MRVRGWRSSKFAPYQHSNPMPAARKAAILAAGCIAAGLMVCLGSVGTAFALSEIQREGAPASAPSQTPDRTIPLPDPAVPSIDTPAQDLENQAPDSSEPAPEDAEQSEPDGPVPTVEYDMAKLPEPVQRTRNGLLEAAKSGDVEKLRPFLGSGDEQTQLSLGGIDGDPIQFLKEASGDEQGQEILAILEEVLSAGYVHMEAGTPNELYVWPYFFAFPIDKLTPPQRVELFKIVTAGDYEDMKTYGGYIFYRVGITPDGKWSFFLAGD